MKMKILITGSEGYIGTILKKVLLDAGYEVAGIDNCFYSSSWLYGERIDEIIPTLKKDIRDISVEDLKSFDAAIHLAELSNDPLGEINPETTFNINHIGTVNLAKKSKEAGVRRFIYFSSCSVYGASDDILDEKSPVNPLTTYAKCKVLNENELSKMADDSFSPVIFRNATVYGASPSMRFDLVVNKLSALAWTIKKIKMQSDGKSWRPFIHILDVCDAVLCALNAPVETVHNQIFNVGYSTSNYQIRDIAEIISNVFQGCEVSVNKESPDKRTYKVNFDKISSSLPGFKCKRNVETGVKELLEIFRTIDMNKEIFESKDFTRIKKINFLIQSGKVDINLMLKK